MGSNNLMNFLKNICSITLLLLFVSCASLPNREYTSEAERLYYNGIFYLQHGNGFNDYYQRALESFDTIIEKYKGSKYEPLARLGKADTFFQEGEYQKAAIAYDEFITLYPFKYPEVLKAKYKLALCYYKLSESFDRDQHYTKLAYNSFIDFLSICQQNKHTDFCKKNIETAQKKALEMRDKLARRIMYIAKFYLKRNYKLAAINRLKELIQKYPDSSYSLKASKLLKKLEAELWNTNK